MNQNFKKTIINILDRSLIALISDYKCPGCDWWLIKSGPTNHYYFCKNINCVIKLFNGNNKNGALEIYGVGYNSRLICVGTFEKCYKTYQNIKVFL